MKKVYFLLSLFIGVCMYGQDDGFFNVAYNDEDVFSIRREGESMGKKEAWVRVETKPKKIKNKYGKIVITKSKVVSMHYWKCNCAYKRYDVDEEIYYDTNGNITERKRMAKSDVRPIPNTISEILFNEICSDTKHILEKDSSEYDKGFIDGFKEGYCYPLASDCYKKDFVPLVKSSDFENTYLSGYYLGYDYGKASKQEEIKTKQPPKKPVKKKK